MTEAFVERPKGVDSGVVERLRKTVSNGQAVTLPLNGEERHTVRERYRMHLKAKYHVRMRSKQFEGGIKAWVEKG